MRVRIPPKPFVKVSILHRESVSRPQFLTQISVLLFLDGVFVVQPLPLYLLDSHYSAFPICNVTAIVTEHEFINVSVKVLFAHMMERSHNSALQKSKPTLNGIRVSIAIYILTRPVIYNFMRDVFIFQSLIGCIVIGYHCC